MKKVIKAGKLANGFERGKGKIVHLVFDEGIYYGPSLCGEVAAIQFIEVIDKEVTCKKCIKLNALELKESK